MVFDKRIRQITAAVSVIIVGKYELKGQQTMRQLNTVPKKLSLPIPHLSDVLPTIFMVLVSRSEVLGMYPFAAAFFAAVYNKNIGYLGIAAACVGIATTAGAAALPRYILSLTLYWFFSKMYKRSNPAVKSAATGAAAALGGGIMLCTGYNGIFDVFLVITESVTSALMYIIFAKAYSVAADFTQRRSMTSDEYVSVAVAVGAIVSGLCGIGYGSISLTHVLASYILLVTARNTSLAVSACAGLCIGFMSSMSGTGAVIMMGVYGFGAMFAGFMNGYKKIGCFIGYISAMSVMMIYAQNIYKITAGALNPFIGGVMFLLTPTVADEYMRSFFTKSMQVEAVNPSRRVKEYISMRLGRTSDAFRSLYESFFAMSEGRLKKYSDDIGVILDETADRVCSDCKMCGKCWQTDFRRTYKNMLELISTIEHDGRLTAENVPQGFGTRCDRWEQFIYEINHVYELFKRDVLRRSDAVTARNQISVQYNELSRLFGDMAEDIDEGFVFLEDEEEEIVNGLDKIGIVPYEISVIESTSGVCEIYLRLPPTVSHSLVEGVLTSVMDRTVVFEKTENGLSKYTSGAMYAVDTAMLQLPKDGFRENGDSVAMFSVGHGKYYVIIADGMGSGAEAKYESSSVCCLLTSFLKAGFSVKTALGILNSSMCLNMDRETYSTVDLLSIDLYTGEAQMYKIGSAETILLNGGNLRTVTSASVPVGILTDIRTDKKSVVLREGDVILMMSDGITEAGCSASRTEWIKKIVAKPTENMQSLAKEVMDTAMEKNNHIARDDMSVVAIKLFAK